MLELAQKGMGIAGAKMLATDVLAEEDMLGQKSKLITAVSQAANQIAHVYGALPVLQASHLMAELHMEKAHEKGYEEVISSLHRPRKDVGHQWPVTGRNHQDSCTECQLKKKRCMDQRMGSCPVIGWGHAPSFSQWQLTCAGP